MELGTATKAGKGGLNIAASGHVFTLARVARLLGEDEETLADLAMNLEPEDGCL